MPGVGLMVRVVGLGSKDPEFKSCSAVELIPGGVDWLSSFRGRQNECQLAGILCQNGDPSRIMPNSQGDCLSSTNALHRVWSQSLSSVLGDKKKNQFLVVDCRGSTLNMKWCPKWQHKHTTYAPARLSHYAISFTLVTLLGTYK